jgi:hypothetical protein
MDLIRKHKWLFKSEKIIRKINKNAELPFTRSVTTFFVESLMKLVN